MVLLDVPIETTLHTTVIDTPLGPMRLIASDVGLRVCDFLDRRDMDKRVGRIGAADEQADPHPVLDLARRELAGYFAGKLQTFTVPLDLPTGTFSRRAWDELRAIPFGQTRSYAQQAAAIDSPTAVRAVASANGRNFVAIIVPCHRVIGSDGRLTGFGGGLWRKQWLLDHERRVAGGGLFDRS